MGGFFGGDDDEAPPINFTPYTPIDATKNSPPINYMRMFDAISQQEFVFKKSPKGERYLQLKNLIQQKKDEYNRGVSNPNWFGNIKGYDTNLQNEISSLEQQASMLESSAGDTEIQINDLSGRVPLDAPFETVLPEIANLPNVGLNLPNIRELLPFEMRYAAAVSDLSNRLRDLHDTITGLEVSDPMSIKQYEPMIKAFKDANRLAMEKGFDIRYNGLDAKLREMGLNNSTTALGAMITLQKQKVDTEIENNLKEYAFANNLKQQSIDNLIKSGSTLAQQGDLRYKQFAQDSDNQLKIRQQDLGVEELEQQRAKAILNAQLQERQQDLATEGLKLDKGKAERQSELARRELTLNMLVNRDPSKMGLNFIANNNTNATNAIGLTNDAMYKKQSGELQASGLEQERFRNEQAAKSDPFGNMLNTVVGTTIGGIGGGFGSTLGEKWAGVDVKNKYNKK
jgi:hypothetical protein